MKKVEELIPATAPPATVWPARRKRRRSNLLDGLIIEESIGERSDENDEIQSSFHEVIDVTLVEFDKRFTENNDILLTLSKSPEMERMDLLPLEKLGLNLPAQHINMLRQND